jgi:hypothetical protein
MSWCCKFAEGPFRRGYREGKVRGEEAERLWVEWRAVIAPLLEKPAASEKRAERTGWPWDQDEVLNLHLRDALEERDARRRIVRALWHRGKSGWPWDEEELLSQYLHEALARKPPRSTTPGRSGS